MGHEGKVCVYICIFSVTGPHLVSSYTLSEKSPLVMQLYHHW